MNLFVPFAFPTGPNFPWDPRVWEQCFPSWACACALRSGISRLPQSGRCIRFVTRNFALQVENSQHKTLEQIYFATLKILIDTRRRFIMEEKLIAPCGMNCGVCINYLTMKNNLHKQGSHRRYCAGCIPRGKNCTYKKISCNLLEKGLVRFCLECEQFPCKRLATKLCTGWSCVLSGIAPYRVVCFKMERTTWSAFLPFSFQYELSRSPR